MKKKKVLFKILSLLKYPLIGCLTLLGFGLLLGILGISIIILFNGTNYFTGFWDITIRIVIFLIWGGVIGFAIVDETSK